MNLLLKILFASITVVLLTPCYDCAKNSGLAASIQKNIDKLKTEKIAECEMKIPADSQSMVIFFNPYTHFDNIDLEKSTKERLKEISYAKEERGVAVIHGEKISGHCYMPQEVKPARSMPMILTAANGFISIKLKKDKEGIFLY